MNEPSKMLDSFTKKTDLQYDKLRNEGYGGWGGDHFDKRRMGWEKTLRALLDKQLLPALPARSLELGCGNGMISMILAKHGYSVVGVDISYSAIAWARDSFKKNALKAEFIVSNIEDLSYLGCESIDIVVDGNCLHCVIGEARRLCLEEAYRVLKTNGVMVVSTMCGYPISAEAITQFDAKSRVIMKEGKPYRTLLPLAEIKGELTTVGFTIIDTITTTNNWWEHAVITVRKA